ncbi:MAG: hypothetical protein JNM99_01525 [Verrucomicrobiaceae bacterium]|nr:hypothetical protein [Verrucomicrobiaceae bacterium]
MALETVEANEVIYFTNNGWSSSQGQFNGADPAQGAGNESLIKLTITAPMTKGTVFSSAVDGSSWAWTKTGLIPGQEDGFGEFSDLAIDFESDQIYAFQAPLANPLGNPTNFIYALHFGSVDYPGFSDSEDTLTGDVPPGLSTLNHTAFSHTNLFLHGDADGNHSAWGLNLASHEVQNLQANGGHKEDWLAAISNSANWSSVQPSTSSLLVMPEPGRVILMWVGLAALVGARRRRAGVDLDHSGRI